MGTMYSAVDISHPMSLSYIVVYLARRSFFVFLTFMMNPLPGIQIQVFIFSSVLYIIYLNHVP
jgi:hypothetical protein